MPRHTQSRRDGEEVLREPPNKEEMAYKVLKYLMATHGVTISLNKMRDIPRIAKEIGVDKSDLSAFSVELLHEVIEDCFMYNKKKFGDVEASAS
jgi:hypothetical protein